MKNDRVTLNQETTLLYHLYRSRGLKLILALLMIYLFFVVAIGITESIRIFIANKQILADNPIAQTTNPIKAGCDLSWRFLSLQTIERICRQTTIVGIAALGMTLVIIAGGIDLSVGSLVAFSTVVVALMLMRDNINGYVAGLTSLIVGGLSGAITGLLIVRLKVVPFIITLGMMLILRGTATGLAGEQKIDAPVKGLNRLLATLPSEHAWMLFPVGVWMMIICALLIAGMLHYTRLGRHIFAVGSNEETARLCGVAVGHVKVIVYAFCGAFAGLAGLMQFSRLTVGDPTVAVGLELDVIAAVVIGGGSLSGGEGSILGSIIGALIMTVISMGCSQMSLPNWVQLIVTGVILIFAVAMESRRRQRTV